MIIFGVGVGRVNHTSESTSFRYRLPENQSAFSSPENLRHAHESIKMRPMRALLLSVAAAASG
jgi:hypothetical protein